MKSRRSIFIDLLFIHESTIMPNKYLMYVQDYVCKCNVSNMPCSSEIFYILFSYKLMQSSGGLGTQAACTSLPVWVQEGCSTEVLSQNPPSSSLHRFNLNTSTPNCILQHFNLNGKLTLQLEHFDIQHEQFNTKLEY